MGRLPWLRGLGFLGLAFLEFVSRVRTADVLGFGHFAFAFQVKTGQSPASFHVVLSRAQLYPHFSVSILRWARSVFGHGKLFSINAGMEP